MAWVPLVTPFLLMVSWGGRVARWMALGWSFQGDPHLSSAGNRARMAVGVWSWWVLEMAHLMTFIARGVGMWWRM